MLPTLLNRRFTSFILCSAIFAILATETILFIVPCYVMYLIVFVWKRFILNIVFFFQTNFKKNDLTPCTFSLEDSNSQIVF